VMSPHSGRPSAKAVAEVRNERGGPRLFINGREIFPLMALSIRLLETVRGYRRAGIRILAPLIGFDEAWLGRGNFNWDPLDDYLARLQALHPEAFFLPRLHLYAPDWWKEAHPDDLVRYGLAFDPALYRIDKRFYEGGMNWSQLTDLCHASWASPTWRKDAGHLLRAYIRHLESSPLAGRVIGYQVAGGLNGEWHMIGPAFLPDYSAPMKAACGEIPSPVARMRTAEGLLRDPEKEKDVILFYQRFHEILTETLLYFARVVKEETERRILCGAFTAYLLENVMIQEAGHLAPENVLTSPDIDFIVSPYSYQHTNREGQERWESDVFDEAGNWLGRARGVGGDGGYRVLTESLRRHGKLFIVEIDPSTYLEPHKVHEGGSGHQTVEGTLRILRRDLGRMFASGNGGWLFDFGHLDPPYKAKRGWYDSPPIIHEIRRFARLGQKRPQLDIGSPAQILAVYDARSFFVTSHWKAEEPWAGMGVPHSDFFNHWFLDSQARAIHRLGSPADFLYRFDFTPQDAVRYRLILMVNTFFLDDAEAETLRKNLSGSGATVVWFFAPGFVTPQRLHRPQMERLTGFQFEILEEPGPMMIEVGADFGAGRPLVFGVKKRASPRFAVKGEEIIPLGRWIDRPEHTAFARKKEDGWTSIYVGSAPLPVEILRQLARQAGVRMWSSKPDIVTATADAVCLVATDKGKRLLHLPKAMVSAEGGPAAAEHDLDLDFGDVFVACRPTDKSKAARKSRPRSKSGLPTPFGQSKGGAEKVAVFRR